MIAIYSVLHFIVDAICAFAMFGSFGKNGAYAYLLYNLFAFVLQLPVGAVMDLVMTKLADNTAKKRFSWAVTTLGVIITLVGMYAGPLALGFGNALFHSGGGVSCIKEDRDRKLRGTGLGVFVAPGAIGLFVGKLFLGFVSWKIYIQNAWIVVSVFLVLTGLLRLYYEEKHRAFIEITGNAAGAKTDNNNDNKAFQISDVLLIMVSCMAVVIIRSYVGMAMDFDWRSRIELAFIAVLMVALGKAAGGFLAAVFGRIRTICISLWLAGIAFYFSDIAIVGMLALLFFNMTMPITLQMMVERLTDTPGIAFGLLSFGLFIGFLPVYFDASLPITGVWIGVLGSLISLGLLIIPGLIAAIQNKGKK